MKLIDLGNYSKGLNKGIREKISSFLFTYTLYETVFLVTYLLSSTCKFEKHFLLKQIHSTLRYTFELSHILLRNYVE